MTFPRGFDRAREAVAPERLLALLNDRLHESDGCADVRFEGPMLARTEPGLYGENWEATTLRFSGPTPRRRCWEAANRVVDEIARRYDVAWPTTPASAP